MTGTHPISFAFSYFASRAPSLLSSSALFSSSAHALHHKQNAPAQTSSSRRVRCSADIGSNDSSSSKLSSADDSSIARSIAQSFVQACIGTGSYSESVLQFCRATVLASLSGYSLSALRLALSTVSDVRDLGAEDLELREVWLALVYKTLRHANIPGATTSSESYDRFDEFVRDVIAAVRQGYDLKRIQLEQALRQGLGSGDGMEKKARTPMESAVVNQSTRIVVAALQAAQEELRTREGT